MSNLFLCNMKGAPLQEDMALLYCRSHVRYLSTIQHLVRTPLSRAFGGVRFGVMDRRDQTTTTTRRQHDDDDDNIMKGAPLQEDMALLFSHVLYLQHHLRTPLSRAFGGVRFGVMDRR